MPRRVAARLRVENVDGRPTVRISNPVRSLMCASTFGIVPVDPGRVWTPPSFHRQGRRVSPMTPRRTLPTASCTGLGHRGPMRSTPCSVTSWQSATWVHHASWDRDQMTRAASSCTTSTAGAAIPTRGPTKAIVEVARLLRELHDARAGFAPPARSGCPGTPIAPLPTPWSATVMSVRGTSSPGTASRSHSSTGSSPGRWIVSTRWPRLSR